MTLDCLEVGDYYSGEELSELINRLKKNQSLFFAYVRGTSNERPKIERLAKKRDFLIEERFPEEGLNSLEIELRKSSKRTARGNSGFPYLWLRFVYEEGRYRMVTLIKSVENGAYIERNRACPNEPFIKT